MIRASVCAAGHPIDLCPASCGASALPQSRKDDWTAEARYLRKRIQQDQERLAELDEMLRLFFPEVR